MFWARRLGASRVAVMATSRRRETFAMELGGRWSVILDGTGFPEECHRPTVKAVAALVHPLC